MYAYIYIKFAIVCFEDLNLIFIYKILLNENIYIAAKLKKILVNVALIQTTYCLQCNLKLYNFIRDKIYNYTKSPIS